MRGHPVLRHSPTAFCPSALSLNPTWAVTNLSLRFELCHLPPSSAPRPSSSSLSPALVGQRRSPSAAQPRACRAGSSLASRNWGWGGRLWVTAGALGGIRLS